MLVVVAVLKEEGKQDAFLKFNQEFNGFSRFKFFCSK
jgi:hypothetical protein